MTLGQHTQECLDSLDGDPRFYTTTIAMHDIDAARDALGYDQVNLYGGSYGTRAAQVYLRLFPDRVRSVVLDGVVPQTLALGTEHARKLDQAIFRVLAGCDEDPLCGEAFPDSAGKLTFLIRVPAGKPGRHRRGAPDNRSAIPADLQPRSAFDLAALS